MRPERGTQNDAIRNADLAIRNAVSETLRVETYLASEAGTATRGFIWFLEGLGGAFGAGVGAGQGRVESAAGCGFAACLSQRQQPSSDCPVEGPCPSPRS